MLFTPELRQQIAQRSKTQTRRPCKPDEVLRLVKGLKTVYSANGRIKYQVGRDYSIQYGYGKPCCIWNPDKNKIMPYDQYMRFKDVPQTEIESWGYQPFRYQITNIRFEDVRNISQADGLAEGFEAHKFGFWQVWTEFYDKRAYNQIEDTNVSQAHKLLTHRPDQKYFAWAITFKPYIVSMPEVQHANV